VTGRKLKTAAARKTKARVNQKTGSRNGDLGDVSFAVEL
jgi:hypothetical protein